MRGHRYIRTRGSGLWLMLAIACCATACVSTRLAPIDRADFVPESDERDLWQVAAKLDDHLVKSGLVYGDPILQDYLSEITHRLLVSMGSPDVEVRVSAVSDPTLNAFALPNGSIYLHTGLMARIENEAQLAVVLGHELEHFLGRHLLKEVRTAKNKRTAADVVLGTLAVALAAASGDPGVVSGLLDLGGEVADPIIRAQVNGYSRNLERDADSRGLDAMFASGYAPGEARRLFELLLDEVPEGEAEPFVYASHPHMRERLEDTEEWLSDLGQSSAGEHLLVRSDAYAEVTRELVLANAGLDLRIGRPDRALPVLERYVARWPDSARGYTMLGRIQKRMADRQMGYAAAIAAFENAARLEPDEPTHFKELGLLYRFQGRPESACAAFERYVELAPEAVDRPIIEGYLDELGSPETERGPR